MATETQPESKTTDSRLAVQTPSARNKAAILAEMESANIGPSEPQRAEAKKPEPAPEPEAAEEPEVEAKTEEEPEAEPEEPEQVDEADDEETAKGIERIKAEEKRSRMKLAKEREDMHREFAERESQYKAQLSEAQQKVGKWEKLASRAQYNPAGLLLELGIPKERLAKMSQMIYLASPEGQADPKYKDHADRMAKELEYEDRVRQLDERQTRLEEEAKAAREQSEREQAIGAYMDGVVKEITPDVPLVHRQLEKQPHQTRADLRQIAEVMAEEHAKLGTEFTQADVVKMLEKVMLLELEEAGIDTSQYTKPKAKPAAKPAPKPAETASSAQTTTKRNGNWRAGRDEILKEMESL